MRRLIVTLLMAAASAGCREEFPTRETGSSAPLGLGLLVSRAGAAPGTTIAVELRLDAGAPVAGLGGWLRFDPTTLRYLGQPGPEGPFTITNVADAGRGVVRTASLAMPRLPGRAGSFAFEVVREGYETGLRYDLDQAVDARGAKLASRVAVRIAGIDPSVAIAAVPRVLTLADWAGVLGDGDGPQLVPGAGLRFGDATLDGVINIIDAFGAANLSVGNQPLIIDAQKDYVVAANVFPFNAPGLGEASDPVPPGLEANGSRLITIVDAVAIANEAVGNDQPIVGETIPGRALAANRVVLTGVIAANRTLTRDTIYELQGLVKVAAGITLTIDAGTRLEGEPTSRGALMVIRGARIEANGTFLEPVVMTCASATPAPGCWGGLVLNGFALLNNDVVGPGEIEVCPTKPSIGSTNRYGGCLNGDGSGVLRYLRIEHAGQGIAGSPTPGLALLGVGLGTVVDYVQVHGSAGPGIFVSGGVARLRHAVITASGGAGLSWDDGWQGLVQFLVVQQGPMSAAGLLGSNYPLNPNAGPRSKPTISHATIVGAPGGMAGATGVALAAGSGLLLRSSIVMGFPGAGWDVDDQASCDLAGGGDLAFESNYLDQNGEPFSSDVDCIDEVALGGQPTAANVLANPLLIAPFNTLTIDIRPAFGSPASAGAAPALGDPFFDALALYFGATDAATPQGNLVPWFTGWIRGWSGPIP